MDIDFEDQIISKSNKELIDIYTNPSEYQKRLVALAKEEVIRRNNPIDALEELKAKQEAVVTQSLTIGKKGDVRFTSRLSGFRRLKVEYLQLSADIFMLIQGIRMPRAKSILFITKQQESGGLFVLLGLIRVFSGGNVKNKRSKKLLAVWG